MNDPIDEPGTDPFEAELVASMQAAAAPIRGDGASRAGVDAAIARRRSLDRRRLAVGAVAAAVAVVAAGAVVALGGDGGGGGAQRVGSGPPTSAPASTSTSCAALPPPSTSSTLAPIVPPTTTPGTTPFDLWAQVLRERGLLTPEQEADIAAGRGISLTAEQSQVIDALWRSDTTTTDPPAPTPYCTGEDGRLVAVDPTLAVEPVPGASSDDQIPAGDGQVELRFDEGTTSWLVAVDVFDPLGSGVDGDVDPERRWLDAQRVLLAAGYRANLALVSCLDADAEAVLRPLADEPPPGAPAEVIHAAGAAFGDRAAADRAAERLGDRVLAIVEVTGDCSDGGS